LGSPARERSITRCQDTLGQTILSKPATIRSTIHPERGQ
jgi:hypothetical protein